MSLWTISQKRKKEKRADITSGWGDLWEPSLKLPA